MRVWAIKKAFDYDLSPALHIAEAKVIELPSGTSFAQFLMVNLSWGTLFSSIPLLYAMFCRREICRTAIFGVLTRHPCNNNKFPLCTKFPLYLLSKWLLIRCGSRSFCKKPSLHARVNAIQLVVVHSLFAFTQLLSIRRWQGVDYVLAAVSDRLKATASTLLVQRTNM